MDWNCHECGEPHGHVPEACRSCGTKPEVFKNAWKCPTCGHEGNDGLKTVCQGCGKDKDKDAQTAVTTERIEGPQGAALANGSWKFCGFCQTQVAPLNNKGQAAENCPTCGGPLDVAARETVVETVSEEAARTYRPQQSRVVGASPPGVVPSEPPREPAPKLGSYFKDEVPSAPRQVPWGPLGLAGLVVLGVLGLWAVWNHMSRDLECSVSGRDWSRSIEVERSEWRTGSGWKKEKPFDAEAQTCSPRFYANDNVYSHSTYTYSSEEDRSTCASWGTRQVTSRVSTGFRCAAKETKKNGGVSVSSCARREETFETRVSEQKYCRRYGTKQVRHEDKHYVQVPRYEDYCQWRYLTWVHARTLRADTGEPKWPEAGLGPGERENRRSENYTLRLSCPTNKDQPTMVYSLQENGWTMFQVGSKVIAHAVGDTVTQVRPAP